MTLADHLRSLPDDELAAVLRARPDLAVPAPEDLPGLAARAQSRLSIARALEKLDRFTLESLDALRLFGEEASADAVVELVVSAASARDGTRGATDQAAHVGTDPTTHATVDRAAVEEAARAAIAALRQQILVYGPDARLRVTPGVEECCSPYPAGLGRPAAALSSAAAELAADPTALREAVTAAPEPARRVLDRLAAGPPVGAVADAQRPASDQATDTPVRWLIARRLLVPTGERTVELPREVGLLLRGAAALGEVHPAPPAAVASARDPEKTDAAAAGQTMEAVRQTEDLLEALSAEPAPVLRSGGIGVRDLRRLAREVGLSEPIAALLLETAAAAGLVDDDREAEPRWLPTAAYDRWRILELAARWTPLAEAWLSMTRQPGLVGQRDERDRLTTALSGDVERIGAPPLRLAVLRRLAECPEGNGLSADDIVDQLAWQAPRRGGRQRDDSVRWALAQAGTLGLTGLGALASYTRPLLTGQTADAAAALDKLLPAPVDHVLVQADLTVVAPGPPEPTLAAELALVADPESSGGATVYRVTPASVRRALDAGMTADELHGLFVRRSITPAPQALTYLIDDTARRHGGMRVGSAGSYLRSEDEAQLAEVLADKRLSHLSLRRLAGTVLVSPYAPARLLSALREAGHTPAPEDTTGAVVLVRPDVRRAPGRSRTPAAGRQRELDRAQAKAVVDALRRNDARLRAARRAPVAARANDATPVGETLAVLQQALRDRRPVWVGYVDGRGDNASRLVTPVSMSSGYLRAEDSRTDMAHTFALHRITSVTAHE